MDKENNLNWNPEELERTLLSFGEIQGELNYKKAQESLRDLVVNLDLTEKEQQGLTEKIERLTVMLDKLENSVISLAVFGMVGRGKSSILNALLGENLFETGALHGVTKKIESAKWKVSQNEIGKEKQTINRVALSGIGNSQIQLIDTPGIDEVGGETREILAQEIAKQSDLILFIIAGDMTRVEYDALSQLREVGKPMLLVFNKIDQYPEADRLEIYRKIRDERVKQLLSPEEIVMVAASPLCTEAMNNQGKIEIKRYRGQPEIETLKLKILEVLHQEGKSLIALNTMLYANEVNEEIIQRKMMIREELANEIINKTIMIKALAIALNPVTVLDLFSGAVIDVTMIINLSQIYNIAMSQKGAIQLLKKIALSMGGISGSELLANIGLSGLKGILGLSTPLTGGLTFAPYLSVAIAQGSVAGLSTMAIAQVTKTYLANGASWKTESPKMVVKRILESLDETSIIHRIKQELQEKLTLKRK
jgi:small GTP-binding protein